MQKKMEEVNMLSVNVAADPAGAIERITDPVLQEQETEVDRYTEILKKNLQEICDLKEKVVEAKNKLFEEKMKRVNLEAQLDD